MFGMLRSMILALGLVLVLAGGGTGLVTLGASAAFATVVQPHERMADPEMEERAMALYAQMRCLVCQNQSIKISNAGHASDMRAVIRERIRAGDTDAEIKAYLTARYGDFVLLSPPVNSETFALWYGPPTLLALGVFGIGVYFWRRRRGDDEAEQSREPDLNPDERKRLDAILKGQDETR